jgi:hypothetical protein
MLSREDNELLCWMGPGTPMGKLMREYWPPCLPSSEFLGPDSLVKRMTLLGENFVMWRDTTGRMAGPNSEAIYHRPHEHLGTSDAMITPSASSLLRPRSGLIGPASYPEISATSASTACGAQPYCCQKTWTGLRSQRPRGQPTKRRSLPLNATWCLTPDPH